MKKVSACVILISLFLGGAIFAKTDTKVRDSSGFALGMTSGSLGMTAAEHCQETFVLSDRYDHDCAVNKHRWHTVQEAIQKCLFKVDVSSCEKSLQIDTIVNANCYEFALKRMQDAEASELCRLNSYRCRF